MREMLRPTVNTTRDESFRRSNRVKGSMVEQLLRGKKSKATGYILT